MRIDLIAKCLELTASDKDGEALAAVRKANELRAKIGKSWAEMLFDKGETVPNLDTTVENEWTFEEE